MSRRKAASSPKAVERLGAHLVQSESGQRDGLQPSRQRLGRLPEQVGARAAEDQKPCGQRAPVGQDAQEREEVGPALDFINDDHATQRPQGRHRLGQAGEASRIFQVEVSRGIGRYDLTGNRGLARLARPHQGGDPAAFQRGADRGQPASPLDHASTLP